jgi:mono/diheme cytochrome c family protein
MKLIMKGLIAAGLLAITSAFAPTALVAQRSGVEIWSQSCGSCHAIQPANRYTGDQWETIMENMKLVARLTDADAEAILEFLKGGAKRTAEASPVPEAPVLARLASLGSHFVLPTPAGGAELYERQCAACHGTEGKGDGPVAGALNPPPSDLSDPARMSQLSDEELLEVITNGRGTMPGYARQLSPGDLKAVADYVRSLSAKQPQK